MPYFVYRITPPRTLTYLDTKDNYREAKQLVRELRGQQPAEQLETIRMIFAKTQGEAEKLLSQPRDERVIGED